MKFRPIHIHLNGDLKRAINDLRVIEHAFIRYSRALLPIDDGAIEILPLLTPGGKADFFDSDPNGVAFRETVHLKKAKYLRALIKLIPGCIFSARLVRLAPGAKIIPHQDNFRNLRAGILRLHYPLETNSRVKIFFGSRGYHWAAGKFWLGDFSQRHSVVNRGLSPRTHLVIDFAPGPSFFRLAPEMKNWAESADLARINKCVSPSRKELRFCLREFVVPRGFLDAKQESLPAKTTLSRAGLNLTLLGRAPISLEKFDQNAFRLKNYGPEKVLIFEKDRVALSLCGAVSKGKILDLEVKVPTDQAP